MTFAIGRKLETVPHVLSNVEAFHSPNIKPVMIGETLILQDIREIVSVNVVISR